MAEFSNRELLKCVEREIMMRRRVYPRRVADNQMTQAQADQELQMMELIGQHYRTMCERDEPTLFGSTALPLASSPASRSATSPE